MIAQGITLALLLLLLHSLGLTLWASLPRKLDPPPGGSLLAVLALALCGIGAQAWVAQTLAERLSALTAGGMLCLLAWDALARETDAADTLQQRACTLAAAGALLVAGLDNLLGLWLGVVLWRVARQHRTNASLLGTGGLALAALGLALIYAGAGTLETSQLSLLLWQQAGPLPATLYVGVSLLTAGTTLALAPFGDRPIGAWADTMPDLCLAALVLARLRLDVFSALAGEWRWALLLAGLVVLIAGLSRWRPEMRWRLELPALAQAQRGLLLVALALADAPLGIQAAASGLVGYMLAHLMLRRILGDWVAPSKTLDSLVRRDPARGIPALLALLSLVGMPLTIGFRTRWALFLGVQAALGPVAAWAMLGVAVLLALLYVPWLILPLGEPSEDQPDAREGSEHPWLLWAAGICLQVLGLAGPAWRALTTWLLT